ncbi:MAG: hypothetical protein P1U89_09600 [Verrucomicrobiales bacterium]|nr:hypothetical protein [Verrucomicrobiales bacterium]
MEHLTTYKKSSGAAIFWSWFLLIATCVISLVPVVGFVAWIVGIAAVAIASILAIVIIGEGNTTSGVLILIAAFIFTPLFVFVAPVASSAIFVTNLKKVEAPLIEVKKDAITDQRIERAPQSQIAVPE